MNIFLFGKFQAMRGEVSLAGLESQKVQELFCYLLLSRHRHHPRESLADLLWPHNSTAQSRTYLRKTLWQLQTALNCHKQHFNDCALVVEPNWVKIDKHADIWIDVEEFENAFLLVQGIPGKILDVRRFDILKNAVDLYKGDLLEGWYQDWCLYERERLKHMYMSMLDKLIDYHEAHFEYETGIRYGVYILRYDRARESTHRRLMRLYYLAGDRTMALRQYERCVKSLEENLGVQPAERTKMLYEKIKHDQMHNPDLALKQSAEAIEEGPNTVSGVLVCLKQLRAVLIDAQREIQKEIQSIERILSGRE